MHVCKLKKALYGLKQAPRAWYGRIDGFLTKFDPKIYFKVIEDEHFILLLYVDDLFPTGNEKQIVECKKKFTEDFRPWSNTLFPRSGSMKESFSIIPLKKACLYFIMEETTLIVLKEVYLAS